MIFHAPSIHTYIQERDDSLSVHFYIPVSALAPVPPWEAVPYCPRRVFAAEQGIIFSGIRSSWRYTILHRNVKKKTFKEIQCFY